MINDEYYLDLINLPNSLNQVNQDHQRLKDRYDVNKAFEEWIKKPVYFNYTQKERLLSFAVFFAERVKGGKLI